MEMVMDNLKKAYRAGWRYASTKARANGDGATLSAHAKKRYDNADEQSMFVAGVYDAEHQDFNRNNPDYTGNGWS
jgi:hypothetical protein